MGPLFRSPKPTRQAAAPPPPARTPDDQVKAAILEIAPGGSSEDTQRRAKRAGTKSLQIPAPGLNIPGEERYNI
jgi:hypothetical protein|tara:strand:+ start:1242 stop:1463 length:222 start_codon:yes stop_codon:yes gene_type:complete